MLQPHPNPFTSQEDQLQSPAVVDRVLSRHGCVTSVHVHHDTGQVLIGATADASLVVSGDEGVNLGPVHTTFRALEEKS